MGSKSDQHVMEGACDILEEFKISYEERILSAHRTPTAAIEYAQNAHRRDVVAIIAGAGGTAHLPGLIASYTTIPVLAVPISNNTHDFSVVMSIINMPAGIPVHTFSVNGSKNAALAAVSILALHDNDIREKLIKYRLTISNKSVKDDAVLIQQNKRRNLCKK